MFYLLVHFRLWKQNLEYFFLKDRINLKNKLKSTFILISRTFCSRLSKGSFLPLCSSQNMMTNCYANMLHLATMFLALTNALRICTCSHISWGQRQLFVACAGCLGPGPLHFVIPPPPNRGFFQAWARIATENIYVKSDKQTNAREP